jgi:hypothetical protein
VRVGQVVAGAVDGAKLRVRGAASAIRVAALDAVAYVVVLVSLGIHYLTNVNDFCQNLVPFQTLACKTGFLGEICIQTCVRLERY